MAKATKSLSSLEKHGMDFYYSPISPPTRAVMMVIAHLGLKVNMHHIDLTIGEQLQKSYLKLNPWHTVPLLIDGNLCIYEGRAIMIYLAEKSGDRANVYPKDLAERTIVNTLLFKDMEIYECWCAHMRPAYEAKPPDPTDGDRYEAAMKIMDTYMAGRKYVALERITLADFSFLASLTYPEAAGYSLEKFHNIHTYQLRMKTELPYYGTVNDDSVKSFAKLLTSVRSK